MWKYLWNKFGPNLLDLTLKVAQLKQKKRFLIAWNRGLGDIALGLYALIERIKTYIPDAEITFLTRDNLKEGFQLLKNVHVLVAPKLKRGAEIDPLITLLEMGISPSGFDVIMKKPDPTRWLNWQYGKVVPKLSWRQEWEDLWKQFPLEKNVKYVGAHVQTETNYGTWRNWPVEKWQHLFQNITERGTKVLLFGFEKNSLFSFPNVIDLRGETNLFQLLSIIKNCCHSLIVPDSGVSAMTYYLNTDFPIQLISLWAEPYMGILKQNVQSPNSLLKHFPILGENKDISRIEPKQIEEIIFA